MPAAANFCGKYRLYSASSDLSNIVLDLFRRFLAALGTIALASKEILYNAARFYAPTIIL